MKKISLHKADSGESIAAEASLAENFIERFIGLLSRSALQSEEALVIPRCASVHMFFMRFPLDVLFCSREMEILQLVENLRPWRISPYVSGAYYAVELPVNKIRDSGLAVGDTLLLKNSLASKEL
jgi:hypothetical protein